jgi:transcriptional antiterminator RfaH
MNCNWYLIHAKARQERMAEMNLQRLGVETFFPRIQGSKTSRGKIQAERERPLFPGYLFVKVDMTREFRKVSYAHGVLSVVKCGLVPVMVEEEIIHSIRVRDEQGLVNLVPSSSLKSGQVVRIAHGHFRGFDAIFQQELNGMERVALLLKTVAYQGRVVLGRDCLAV